MNGKDRVPAGTAATSDGFLNRTEANVSGWTSAKCSNSRKGSSVPIETRRKPTRASVFNRGIGVENNSPGSRVPNEVSGNTTSHFFAHSLPSPNKECHYCQSFRDFRPRLGIGHIVPLACDFVVSREKQRCPQFVLGVIKVVWGDEFRGIIQPGEASGFSVEMRDGRRWERDQVLLQYSRKRGIFLCRQLGQQGTCNDQSQSYQGHRYKTQRRKVSQPAISGTAVIEVRGRLNQLYGNEDAAER